MIGLKHPEKHTKNNCCESKKHATVCRTAFDEAPFSAKQSAVG